MHDASRRIHADNECVGQTGLDHGSTRKVEETGSCECFGDGLETRHNAEAGVPAAPAKIAAMRILGTPALGNAQSLALA
jgi:hypothetical protein